MKKNNDAIKDWFPFYVGDWLTSLGLRICTPFDRGVLIDLMAYSWQNGTPGIIIEDVAGLSSYLNCSENNLSNALAMLEKQRCIVRTEGHIRIKRLREIEKEQSEKHVKRVEAGRKGGLAKAAIAHNPSNATAMLSNALPLDKIREEEIRTREQDAHACAREDTPSKSGTKAKSKNKRFKPPTVAEVQAYITEKGYVINAVAFVSHYESVGWKVGKNKMCNWRAAVAGWNSREQDAGGQHKGRVPKKDVGFEITVRFSDRRQPEAYHIKDEKELQETIDRMDLTPIKGCEYEYILDVDKFNEKRGH